MDIFNFPLTRVTLCFVTGIALAANLSITPSTICIMALITLPVFIIAYIFSRKHFFQRLYFGIALTLLSIITGMFTYNVHSGTFSSTRFSEHISGNDSVHRMHVILRERLKSTQKNDRYIALVRKIGTTSCTGKVLINVKRDSISRIFPVGSILSVDAPLILHQPPTNPGQFDYGKYLQNKSILAQAFVSASKISIGKAHRKDVWYYSDMIRTQILKNLQKSKLQPQELNVLAALLLGQQQDISRDVLRDYQYAGAVHILSVSGLHVGFILLFIHSILKLVPKGKMPSLLRIIVVITCLWSFAVIAGFSPSVVRSVTMFSFIAVGMHLRRDTNIYHTLLISILLILLFQPSFVFDVGFQLSYAALFFILWLQPIFSSLWQPKHKVVKYLWDILTVSFAAQIGTFPLSVYYFHQFPGLFFVTNLIVIPFLSIIMAVGVVAMLIAVVGRVPDVFIWILQHCIEALNAVIAGIASAEEFIVKDIPFNSSMLITSYIAICLIILSIKRSSFARLALATSAVLAFQLCILTEYRTAKTRRALLVFDVRKGSLLAEISSGKTIAYTDLENSKTILQPYLTASFSTLSQEKPIANVMFFQNTRIIVVDSSSTFPPVPPDVLIFRQSPKLNLDRVLKQIRPKILVVDGSNYRSYVKRWESTCKKAKIPFHYTSEKGFYTFQ
ncbi:MAG TPA: ComEC/Rec2 family competence protein [Flavobacterium sp.]|jgi:competence protein ComEC